MPAKRKVFKLGPDWFVAIPRFGFSAAPHIEALLCEDWSEAMSIADRGLFGAPSSAAAERATQFDPFHADGSDRWAATGRTRATGARHRP